MPRSRRTLLPALAALAALLSSPAAADVVTTADGLVLEGRAEKAADGSWRVTTADGTTTLPAASVRKVQVGVGPRESFLKQAAAVPETDAAGQYRLAVGAAEAGFADLATEALARVVKAEPDHPAARRALGHERVDGAWLPSDEARRRRGLVLFGGKWLLPQEVEAAGSTPAPAGAAPAAGPSGDAQVAAWVRATGSDVPAVSRAAQVALSNVPKEKQLAAALLVLYDREPSARRASARHLGLLGDESALRALLLTGARDVDASVRREAVLAAQSFGNDDVAIPFIRALGSENPRTAANAAEAIALLGDQRAAPYVIKRLSSHGSSTRNFVAFLNQVSYVRDYDVEIAQASNIANPDIGTLQEGTVLDARVLDAWYESTWMENVLLGTLSALAGRELRTKEDAIAWYRQRQGEIPDFPPTPSRRSAAR
jgi:hypothetical protein